MVYKDLEGNALLDKALNALANNFSSETTTISFKSYDAEAEAGAYNWIVDLKYYGSKAANDAVNTHGRASGDVASGEWAGISFLKPVIVGPKTLLKEVVIENSHQNNGVFLKWSNNVVKLTKNAAPYVAHNDIQNQPDGKIRIDASGEGHYATVNVVGGKVRLQPQYQIHTFSCSSCGGGPVDADCMPAAYADKTKQHTTGCKNGPRMDYFDADGNVLSGDVLNGFGNNFSTVGSSFVMKSYDTDGTKNQYDYHAKLEYWGDNVPKTDKVNVHNGDGTSHASGKWTDIDHIFEEHVTGPFKLLKKIDTSAGDSNYGVFLNWDENYLELTPVPMLGPGELSGSGVTRVDFGVGRTVVLNVNGGVAELVPQKQLYSWSCNTCGGGPVESDCIPDSVDQSGKTKLHTTGCKSGVKQVYLDALGQDVSSTILNLIADNFSTGTTPFTLQAYDAEGTKTQYNWTAHLQYFGARATESDVNLHIGSGTTATGLWKNIKSSPTMSGKIVGENILLEEVDMTDTDNNVGLFLMWNDNKIYLS